MYRALPCPSPRILRMAATWTRRLFSSTTKPGHSYFINSFLEPTSPERSTRAIKISKARLPRATGRLCSSSTFLERNSRYGPKHTVRSCCMDRSVKGPSSPRSVLRHASARKTAWTFCYHKKERCNQGDINEDGCDVKAATMKRRQHTGRHQHGAHPIDCPGD